MRIIRLKPGEDFSEAVVAAVAVLRKGGSIVFPTDTVYGLGTNATDAHAARMIYRIKNRPQHKALPVLVRNIKWAREVAHIPPKLEAALEKVWPGPVTVVLPKKDIIPPDTVAGEKSVGLRVADYPMVDDILGKYGYPLATTSANISGEDGSDDPAAIFAGFKDQMFQPDLMIDVGKLPTSQPSTVVDFTTIKPRILRVGPTKPEELLKILGGE